MEIRITVIFIVVVSFSLAHTLSIYNRGNSKVRNYFQNILSYKLKITYLIKLNYCFWQFTDFKTVTYTCPNTVEGQSYIISPNFPQKYGNREDCTWTLKADAGSYIKLSNIHFDVAGDVGYECYDYDAVRIYDLVNGQGKLIGSYCNGNNPFHGLLSNGNELKIQFTSNWKTTLTGFKIGYSLVKPG